MTIEMEVNLSVVDDTSSTPFTLNTALYIFTII